MDSEDSDLSNGSLGMHLGAEFGPETTEFLSKQPSSYIANSPGKPEPMPFGGDIPRLSVSMTPWRISKPKERSFDELKHSYLDSHRGSEPPQALPTLEASPLNSRPRTRNSLFSEDGVSSSATAAASASSSTEIENLQRQLTTYKLKLRILTELLREINYTRDGCTENSGTRSQTYAKLIEKLPAHDKAGEIPKELEELRQTLDVKNKEIIELKQELVSSNEEYKTVLNDINSYLEHSDVIAGNIDELLGMFSANLTLSAEEADALEKARGISNNFLDVKMNALASTIRRFLDIYSTSQHQESREFTNSTALEDSHTTSHFLDPQLEGAIETMHEEYNGFLRGLQDKMMHGAETERILDQKLEKQRDLLAQLAFYFENQPPQISGNKHLHKNGVEDRPTINDFENNSRTSFDYGERDSEVVHDGRKVYEENETGEGHSKRVSRNESSANQVALDSWLNERQSLMDKLSVADAEVQQLTTEVELLRSEISLSKSESENAIADLEKTLKRAVRKSGLYISENRDMHSHIMAMEHELQNITNHNQELQKGALNIKRDYSLLENEYHKFRSHLLLHLNKVFDVFEKILQTHSINQAKGKLKALEDFDIKDNHRPSHAKLESLYVFIETAINTVVEEHAKILLKEKEKRSSRLSSQEENPDISSSLRIELLERKWVAERERRKLDAAAAEYRILHLEDENKQLRQRLRQSYKGES
ncbi:LAFA_0C10132g1_1 [Lachancea sp. 'fantastica']|nr:LAFA_0C10132g1_1 [Lachancea sp. 'fantastica']